MSSKESKEFVDLRNAEYLRAAIDAKNADRSFEIEREPEVETSWGKCSCCNQWKMIPVRQHVCEECWREML